MVIIACSSSDSEGDAAKLWEFQRMQRMHRQQTEDTENTINQSSGVFHSLIYNGRPSLQVPWPSLSVPSCSSPSLSVVGYGQRISGGSSHDMPSSWTCCAIPQVGLSLPQSQTQGLPDQFCQSPYLHSQPLPLTSGCALPLGGRPCPRPTNFWPLPSKGFRSLQLLFPQIPPVVYHGGHQPFSQCGFPGCGRVPQYPQCRQDSLPYRSQAQLEFREPRFTELDSSSNTLKRRSSRVGEPVREAPPFGSR